MCRPGGGAWPLWPLGIAAAHCLQSGWWVSRLPGSMAAASLLIQTCCRSMECATSWSLCWPVVQMCGEWVTSWYVHRPCLVPAACVSGSCCALRCADRTTSTHASDVHAHFPDCVQACTRAGSAGLHTSWSDRACCLVADPAERRDRVPVQRPHPARPVLHSLASLLPRRDLHQLTGVGPSSSSSA